MKWNQIPESERKLLLDKKKNNTLTASDAARWGIHYPTLKRRLREMAQQERELSAAVLTSRIQASDPQGRVYNDYFHLIADDVMICSDWEFPDTDPDMLILMLLTAVRYNIRTLIIAGDTISGDAEAFTTWPKITVHSNTMSFADEFALLRKILQSYANWFTGGIYIISGNHDERIQKTSRGELNLGFILDYAVPEVKYSLYRYMYLTSPRRQKSWKISHPRNYSRVSLGLAQKLAANDPGPERKGTPVGAIIAHTHHGSDGFTLNGMNTAHGLGCMRDPAKTEYLSLGDATNPRWNQGFMMIRRGYTYSLWKDHSDWEIWLGEKLFQIYNRHKNKSKQIEKTVV